MRVELSTAFTGAIGGIAGWKAVSASDRRYVDNPATLLLQHDPAHRLAAKESPAGVDVHDLLPFIDGKHQRVYGWPGQRC